MRFLLILWCALLVPALAAVPAAADDPNPYFASVKLQFNDLYTITEPTRIVLVPDNQPTPAPRAELEVRLRNPQGQPIPDAHIFVIFSPAATAALCWCAEQNQNTWVLADGRRVFEARTDAQGFTEFQMSAGGCFAATGCVVLKASANPDPQQAIQLRAWNTVANFDNAGAGSLACDRVVDLRDLQRYAVAHLGGPGAYSTCHDYNGDGAVNVADLQLYAQHHLRGASCSPLR